MAKKWDYQKEQKRFIIQLFTGKSLEEIEENNEIIKNLIGNR